MLPLLLILACTADGPQALRQGPAAPPGASDSGTSDSGTSDSGTSDSGTSDSGAPPIVDADGDGWGADLDCDDDDPTVHPEAAEVCDGLDQDCDGTADDGIIHDGDGCRDPGPPDWSGPVDTVHLTLHTGPGTYDGTDDAGAEICLGEGLCLSPYMDDWNDLETGAVDVTTHGGLGWDRAALDRFVVQVSDGGDQWQPVGFEVALDGEPVYCRQLDDLELGDASDEVMSWTDPDGLTASCETIFDAPVTHGPLVGAVDHESARLWVRTHATRPVVFYVATDEATLATAAPVHHAWPRAEDDFTHTATILGLEPAQRYVYAVEVDGVRSETHAFVTAPAPDSPARVRFAWGSCTKDDEQPVFGAVTAWDPDLFLFIGDNHYGNTGDLGALRQNYRWAHERPLRRDLLASVPVLATWDDHDFVGNNTDGSDPGRDAALQAFTEYWANGSYGHGDTPGTFGRHRFGPIELFLLDVRYHRGVDGSLLGAAQRAWLVDALADSDAPFKLLASGSQWSPYGSGDSWAAWPDDRAEIFEAIVSHRVEGVVLLSGDIHRFEIRELTPADGGYPLYDLSSSALANWSDSGCGSDASEPDRLTCLHGFDGFIGLTVDTTVDDPTLSAEIIDADGVVQHRWSVARSALSF